MMVLKLLALAGLVTGFADPGTVIYKNEGGQLIVRNFSTLATDWKDQKAKIQPGQTHIKVVGSPVTVDAPEKGISIVGQTIDVLWAQLAGKKVEFREGLLEGNATVIMDTDWACRSSVDYAVQNNLPKPVTPIVSRFSRADSERITYSGNVDKGTLVFPQSWKYKQTDKGISEQTDNGKSTKVAFDQVFECDGTKGQMVVGPGQNGELNQLQTGSFDGPVHFKLIRHETPEGSSVTSLQSYIGIADRVDIDLLKNPGTITATGHVKVDRIVDGYPSNIVTDWLVLTVNQQLEPLGLDVGTGKLTANDKGGSH